MRCGGHAALWGARRPAHWVLVGKSEIKGPLRDLGVDGRIILKGTSKKWDEASTRLIGLRIGPGGTFL
jgi:hypothetical protein